MIGHADYPLRAHVVSPLFEPRVVFFWEQQVDAVVNRDEQPGRHDPRHFVMGHMEKVDGFAAQCQRQRPVFSQRRAVFGFVELLEILRQGAKLVKIPLGSDQQVIVALVQFRDIPHEVPDVGAYTELVDFADIYRNTHGHC